MPKDEWNRPKTVQGGYERQTGREQARDARADAWIARREAGKAARKKKKRKRRRSA